MSSGTDDAQDCDVLVLGASFAGVEVVYQLVRLSDGKPPSIIVVDRQDAHGYLPLVQERLCERIDPAQTRLPTRAFVESIGAAAYVQAEVVAFDPATGVATLSDGAGVRGRIVVVALGSTVEPPPRNEGTGELLPYGDDAGIPSSDVLVPYKSRSQFDEARAQLQRLLTSGDEDPSVVVVGGGISGVELAGELGDLARDRPQGWAAPRVTLLNAGERLMPDFAPGIGRRVEAALREQGVEVRLGAQVVGAEPGRLTASESGETREVPAGVAYWAAGIRPAPIPLRTEPSDDR